VPDRERASAVFCFLDTNDDGAIVQQEWAAGVGKAMSVHGPSTKPAGYDEGETAVRLVKWNDDIEQTYAPTGGCKLKVIIGQKTNTQCFFEELGPAGKVRYVDFWEAYGKKMLGQDPETTRRQAEQLWWMLDRNHDGSIRLEEWVEAVHAASMAASPSRAPDGFSQQEAYRLIISLGIALRDKYAGASAGWYDDSGIAAAWRDAATDEQLHFTALVLLGNGVGVREAEARSIWWVIDRDHSGKVDRSEWNSGFEEARRKVDGPEHGPEDPNEAMPLVATWYSDVIYGETCDGLLSTESTTDLECVWKKFSVARVGFVALWRAVGADGIAPLFEDASKIFWWLDLDHDGEIDETEWTRAFRRAMGSPMQPPPGYDPVKVAAKVRRLHAFIGEKFDTVDCKMVMLQKGASSKVACAWDQWAVDDVLEFGRLWEALVEAEVPDANRKDTATGVYWYTDADHNGRIVREELFAVFDFANIRGFPETFPPRSYDFVRSRDAFHDLQLFYEAQDQNPWLKATGGSGEPLTYEKFRTAIAPFEAHHRYLNGTIEEETQALFFAADADRDGVISRGEFEDALVNLRPHNQAVTPTGLHSPLFIAIGAVVRALIYGAAAWFAVNLVIRTFNRGLDYAIDTMQSPRSDSAPDADDEPNALLNGAPSNPQNLGAKRGVHLARPPGVAGAHEAPARSARELSGSFVASLTDRDENGLPRGWRSLGDRLTKRMQEAERLRREGL
jgi:Ca2+-binding EF-hand superfamily protein